MTVLVDLPAVRPARLAQGVMAAMLTEHVRDFRDVLRGAVVSLLRGGVRLERDLPLEEIARLADLVRAGADVMPFWHFRLLADPPACRLEVTGAGRAGEIARAMFAEIGR